jgi:hypothetical protein
MYEWSEFREPEYVYSRFRSKVRASNLPVQCGKSTGQKMESAQSSAARSAGAARTGAVPSAPLSGVLVWNVVPPLPLPAAVPVPRGVAIGVAGA